MKRFSCSVFVAMVALHAAAGGEPAGTISLPRLEVIGQPVDAQVRLVDRAQDPDTALPVSVELFGDGRTYTAIRAVYKAEAVSYDTVKSALEGKFGRASDAQYGNGAYWRLPGSDQAKEITVNLLLQSGMIKVFFAETPQPTPERHR